MSIYRQPLSPHDYEIENHVFKMTASIGFVLFNGNQVLVDHLFERGNAALYEAKTLAKTALYFQTLKIS